MTEIDIIVEAAHGSARAAWHAAAAPYLGTVITADISEAVASYLSFSFISFLFFFFLFFSNSSLLSLGFIQHRSTLYF